MSTTKRSSSGPPEGEPPAGRTRTSSSGSAPTQATGGSASASSSSSAAAAAPLSPQEVENAMVAAAKQEAERRYEAEVVPRLDEMMGEMKAKAVKFLEIQAEMKAAEADEAAALAAAAQAMEEEGAAPAADAAAIKKEAGVLAGRTRSTRMKRVSRFHHVFSANMAQVERLRDRGNFGPGSLYEEELHARGRLSALNPVPSKSGRYHRKTYNGVQRARVARMLKLADEWGLLLEWNAVFEGFESTHDPPLFREVKHAPALELDAHDILELLSTGHYFVRGATSVADKMPAPLGSYEDMTPLEKMDPHCLPRLLSTSAKRVVDPPRVPWRATAIKRSRRELEIQLSIVLQLYYATARDEYYDQLYSPYPDEHFMYFGTQLPEVGDSPLSREEAFTKARLAVVKNTVDLAKLRRLNRGVLPKHPSVVVSEREWTTDNNRRTQRLQRAARRARVAAAREAGTELMDEEEEEEDEEEEEIVEEGAAPSLATPRHLRYDLYSEFVESRCVFWNEDVAPVKKVLFLRTLGLASLGDLTVISRLRECMTMNSIKTTIWSFVSLERSIDLKMTSPNDSSCSMTSLARGKWTSSVVSKLKSQSECHFPMTTRQLREMRDFRQCGGGGDFETSRLALGEIASFELEVPRGSCVSAFHFVLNSIEDCQAEIRVEEVGIFLNRRVLLPFSQWDTSWDEEKGEWIAPEEREWRGITRDETPTIVLVSTKACRFRISLRHMAIATSLQWSEDPTIQTHQAESHSINLESFHIVGVPPRAEMRTTARALIKESTELRKKAIATADVARASLQLYKSFRTAIGVT